MATRLWPSRSLSHAPLWCSVDLRDGNQALSTPMTLEQKLELFKTLVAIGFKDIEVGFPSASNTEFEFNRKLIDDNLIPDDVRIQVLVQAREDLILRTIESLRGAKRAIIHMYNSTSPAQRRVVFQKDKTAIIKLAVAGAELIKRHALDLNGTEVSFQYSPESFSATEVDFARDIAEAVMDIWQPSPLNKMILNLPETVEVASPNVYADQIEWIATHIRNRDSLTVSVHTHNDRGTGVAATELAMLAGADRVEGTLFGNGERTGNLDIVTLALNMYMQGISPALDFSQLDKIVDTYTKCTGMTVPIRHPYAGELVFTAFSGSHQDAIKKGLAEREQNPEIQWDVPYLPIDPKDIGRSYGNVVRLNALSGKGGLDYKLSQDFGLELPKELLKEFSLNANEQIDKLGREVNSQEIRDMFWQEYVDYSKPIKLLQIATTSAGQLQNCTASIEEAGQLYNIEGQGNGPLAAFAAALATVQGEFQVQSYHEHALGKGVDSTAIAYIQIKRSGVNYWGAGCDVNLELASIRALLCAVSRSRLQAGPSA